MSDIKLKETWAATFISVFVVAAFGFVFANAWNKVSEAVLNRYEKRDALGRPIKPIEQTFYYAIGITILCAFVLWIIYEYAITHSKK